MVSTRGRATPNPELLSYGGLRAKDCPYHMRSLHSRTSASEQAPRRPDLQVGTSLCSLASLTRSRFRWVPHRDLKSVPAPRLLIAAEASWFLSPYGKNMRSDTDTALLHERRVVRDTTRTMERRPPPLRLPPPLPL